ncbi:MAG TPA: high-potential iron-sulfur protein [Rhizomicrobium sp.]|nr:high-potential iron-sulfur protein [Rhizomicrobium sp.]
MSSEIKDFSRRQLFRGAAVCLAGAAVLASTDAEAKMAQKAAGYQETPAKDGSDCANCALFKAPSSCTLVDGTISPNGWCRFYAKKS